MDDALLIAGCREGKDDAFEALVNKYQVSILSMAWSLLGNKEDAQDAAQGAFLAAFSKLDSFDASRSFKTWLFAIAWKDCLDMKRKEKSRRKYLTQAIATMPGDTPPPRMNDPIEECDTFRPVLKKLEAKERTALSLRINEGFTAAEIADVLGCAESSARVYVFNAIRKIRKIWKEGNAHV